MTKAAPRLVNPERREYYPAILGVGMFLRPLLVLGALLLLVSAGIDQEPKPSPATPAQKPAELTPGPSASAQPSPSARAQQLYKESGLAFHNKDYARTVELLREVVVLEPRHSLAWNQLGRAYFELDRPDLAANALRRAIEIDPVHPYAYNNLARALWRMRLYDEAIANFHKQIEVNPNDIYAHANLGMLLRQLRRYAEAVNELDKAIALTPRVPEHYVNRGAALLELGRIEKALVDLDRAVELSPTPQAWNDVAYELAVHNLQLGRAQAYAESAVAVTEIQLRNLNLENLTRDDLARVAALASYWDTLGWVHSQLGNLPAAEKFVHASWLLTQTGETAAHLGRIYEKMGRKEDTIRAYALALVAHNPRTEIRPRLVALLGGEDRVSALLPEARKELVGLRRVPLKNMTPMKDTQHAEFLIALGPGPKVQQVRFMQGSEALRDLGDALRGTMIPAEFPDGAPILLVRRGTLTCSMEAGCAFNLTPAQFFSVRPSFFSASASAEPITAAASSATDHEVIGGLLSPASPKVPGEASQALIGEDGTVRDLEVIGVGGNVQSAKLLNQVRPSYPPLAKAAHISGTVVLHAIIGKDGTVVQLEVVSGHPLLVQSALDAVRQWRYQTTLLFGEPVEVMTEIDVNFSLGTDSTAAPSTEPSPTPEPNTLGLGKGEARPQGLSHVGGNVSAPTPIQVAAPHKDTDKANIQAARSLTPTDIPALSERAKAGDKNAQAILALAYNWGNGVKQDYAKAAEWGRPAAEKGSAVAQDLLGKLYFLGQGVSKDDAEALKWLQEAAEQGFPEGQYDLGVMYLQGQGVPKDYARAHKLFLKAAEQWHVLAENNLCGMYANGTGVPRDLVTAGMWGVLAASPNNGIEPGRGCMEQISPEMTPDQITEARSRALQWAKGRLSAQTRQITGTIISVEYPCLSFIVSHEADGKKQEMTFTTNLEDAVAASGAHGCTIFPPSGKQMVLKIGSKATIDYLVREHDNLAVSVTLEETKAPTGDKKPVP